MARPTNTRLFLKAVREAGGRVSNNVLKNSLGWDDEKYWAVHSELNDSGLIAKGRGQGGTVILVVPESSEEAERSAAALPEAEASQVVHELAIASEEAANKIEIREYDLYQPTLKQLQEYWTKTKQLLHGVCEITAMQGRRETGGSWSRPDLVAVGLRKFEYIPDRVLEVYTFEIKAQYDISIKGVLEALAHRELAARSYVLYHTGGISWDGFAEAQRIEQLAARHGVGVIVANDINDFNGGWDERVTATRSGSDPETLDRFIKSTLSEDAKSQIRKWLN